MTLPVHVFDQPRLSARSTTERGESSSAASMRAVDHLAIDAPEQGAIVARGPMQPPLPQPAQAPLAHGGNQQPLTNFVHSLRQEAEFEPRYKDLIAWITPCLQGNHANLYYQAACKIIASYLLHQENQLHDLNLAGYSLESLPDSFMTGFNRLTTIDLCNNHLTNFPKFILNSKQLGVLSLEGNKINYIPKELFSLPCLKILDVSNNLIVQLPELPGELPFSCLEELHLGSNSIKSLPQGLSKLQQLKILTLEINEIDSLEHVFSLEELELLVISFNNIKQIPEEIGNLKKLETLIADGNPITEISEKICECSSLKKLSIGNCSIRIIPHKLLQAQERPAPAQVNAQQIDPNDNLVPHLTALHLKDFSYSLEHPSILDETWEKMRNSIYFNEHFRDLYKKLVYQVGEVSVWPEVYRYPNKNIMEHVAKLLRVQLEETYPEEENILWDEKTISLSQGKNLRNHVLERLSVALSRALLEPVARQSLNLSRMRLTRLPKEIGLLGNLESLILNNNHLLEIPEEITELPRLKTLSLEGNPLAGLHPKFGQEDGLQLIEWSDCLAGPEHQRFFTELDNWLNEETNFGQINNENIQKIRQYLGFSYVNYTLQEKSAAGQAEKISLFNQYTKPLVQKHLVNEAALLLSRLDFDTKNCQSETPIFPECYLDNKAKLLNLSGLQLKRLPRVLKYFTKLCELDVSNNQLEEIPEEITQNLKWLRRLNLRNNQLGEWPSSLHQLSRLEFLDYRGNQAVIPPAAAFVAIPSLYMLADWTSKQQVEAVGDALAQSMDNWVNFSQAMTASQIDSSGRVLPWWSTWENLPEQITETVTATNSSLDEFMQELAYQRCCNDFLEKNPDLLSRNTVKRLVKQIRLRYINFVADDLNLNWANKHLVTELKKLEIPNFGLSILPPQLGALARLEIFKIAGNPLFSLPKEMSALRNLHTLCYSSLLALNYLPQEIDLLALASLKNIETSSANFSVYLRLFRLQRATWLRQELQQEQADLSQFSREGNQEEPVQESGLGHRRDGCRRAEAALNLIALANTLYHFAVAGIDIDLEHQRPIHLCLEQPPKLLDPMAILSEFSRKKGIAGIDWIKRLLRVCLLEHQIPGHVVHQQLKMPILTRSHLTFLWDHVQSPEIEDVLKLAWANDSDSGEPINQDNFDFSNFKLFGLPDAFHALTPLQSIDLSENCLAALPPSMRRSTGVTNVNANTDFFATVPEPIAQFDYYYPLRQLKKALCHVIAFFKRIFLAIFGNRS